MLQRVQSLYLFGAAVVTTIFLFVPLWGGMRLSLCSWLFGLGGVAPLFLTLLALLSALVLVLAICLFRARKKQMKLCRVAFALQLALLILPLLSLTLQGAVPFQTHPLSLAFPLVAMVLISLALKAIARDEALVRAADRIR